MITLLLALTADARDAKPVRVACPAPGDVVTYGVSSMVHCADALCGMHSSDVTFQVVDAGGERAHRVVSGPVAALLPGAADAPPPLDVTVTLGFDPAVVAGVAARGPLLPTALDEAFAPGLLACGSALVTAVGLERTWRSPTGEEILLTGSRTLTRERKKERGYVEQYTAVAPYRVHGTLDVQIGRDGWPESWTLVQFEDVDGVPPRTVTIEARRIERSEGAR